MRALGVLGWSLLIVGMVILLVAPLYTFLRSEDLRSEAAIAAERWELGKAEAADAARARLRMWPGIFMGLGLTAVGITLIQIRKRRLELAE